MMAVRRPTLGATSVSHLSELSPLGDPDPLGLVCDSAGRDDPEFYADVDENGDPKYAGWATFLPKELDDQEDESESDNDDSEFEYKSEEEEEEVRAFLHPCLPAC